MLRQDFILAASEKKLSRLLIYYFINVITSYNQDSEDYGRTDGR